jgi:hypothetical protein
MNVNKLVERADLLDSLWSGDNQNVSLGDASLLARVNLHKEFSSNYKTQQITTIEAHKQMWLYSALLMRLSQRIGIR